MSRIRTGWRLARASFALVRADRSLAVFPALATAFAALALALTLTPGLIWSEAADRDWIVLPFLLVGGFGATYAVVYFNVALAGAAQMSMDGRDTTLADGLAVARTRRGLVLRWAIVQFAVGLLIQVARYLASDTIAGRLVAAAASIAGAAWSVSTFFVVPLLALEGLGPRQALERSVGLVKERWGEGLVGSAAITTAVVLVAALPVAALFNTASAVLDVSRVAGSVLMLLAVVAALGACVMGSALGVIFRVELYRYATQGHGTGRFAETDVSAAFQAPEKAAATA